MSKRTFQPNNRRRAKNTASVCVCAPALVALSWRAVSAQRPRKAFGLTNCTARYRTPALAGDCHNVKESRAALTAPDAHGVHSRRQSVPVSAQGVGTLFYLRQKQNGETTRIGFIVSKPEMPSSATALNVSSRKQLDTVKNPPTRLLHCRAGTTRIQKRHLPAAAP